MKNNQNYESRLLKLAQHLSEENLQWVDMTSFNKPQVNTPPPIQVSGEKVTIVTYHWAVIQLPYLWPQHFAFRPDSFLVIARNGLEILPALMEFFNLNTDELLHMWVPCQQEPEIYGGKVIGFNARPRDLAEIMIEFVTRKMTLSISNNTKTSIS